MFLLVISGKERLKSTNSLGQQLKSIFDIYYISILARNRPPGAQRQGQVKCHRSHRGAERQKEKVEQGTGEDYET